MSDLPASFTDAPLTQVTDDADGFTVVVREDHPSIIAGRMLGLTPENFLADARMFVRATASALGVPFPEAIQRVNSNATFLVAVQL